MQAIINQAVPITRLTGGEGCYFFGYYDVAAFDAGGQRHLYHRAGFMDRLPTGADSAELGLIDVETGAQVKIAETTAWNFQQGAMLQWNPAAPDREVVYNIRVGNHYRGVVRDVPTGQARQLERPVAALDPRGRYALSINFSRVFDFRPGYGYHGIVDANRNLEAPGDDGVFRVDLLTGRSSLVLSLQQVRRFLQDTPSVVKNGKIVVNHITCNPGGGRFLALVRNFPEPGGTWGTVAITANADGSDLYLLNAYSMTSHYHWRDDRHLLAYARHAQGDQLYLLRDKSRDCEVVDRDYFRSDGHCSYSPDRKQLLYDSYPEIPPNAGGLDSDDRCRSLYVYDLGARKGRTLATLYSAPARDLDIRCDLHPRWRPDGKAVSFDSTHERQRHIYLARLA